MSSMSSYTNKYHIKTAAPQWGRVGNFAGEDCLLSGGNLMWSDFSELKSKLARPVCTKKSKKFKMKMVQQKQ